MESSIQELLLKEGGWGGRKKGRREGGKEEKWGGERERGGIRSRGEGQFTIKEELQGLAPKNFD